MIAPGVVAAIAGRLAARCGLELPAWVVEARAAARIALRGGSAEAYLDVLDRDASELDALVEAVRVGESRLFRHKPQIDALIALAAGFARRPVRVWSAGCAAGEEPYTLAMVLARAVPDALPTIFATDVSAEALAAAEAARYPRSALAQVPDAYREYLIDDGDTVRIAPAIAARVRFERANLLEGNTPRACDLVWCRNVLIYFTPEARRRAVRRLIAATAPGGALFVGYSESLRDFAELEPVRAHEAVYYVRREGRRPTLVGVAAPVSAPDRTSAVIAAVSEPAPRGRNTERLPDRRDLERTPPPTRLPPVPPASDTLLVRGTPAAAWLTAELSARLALPGLRALTVDLDGAELLDDDLAPVLRRARAAARTAGIALAVRTTRAGARRWLARHGLDEEAA